jgi:hypothetical protein
MADPTDPPSSIIIIIFTFPPPSPRSTNFQIATFTPSQILRLNFPTLLLATNPLEAEAEAEPGP